MMPLHSGTRFGVYEVIALIGAGGMGEVYRAHDTRLGRDVALKVLPASVGSNDERIGRFEREARVLASLNHPNIAAIHGIEEVPAAVAGGAPTRALVLELVEGETLADRLALGPLPLAEALAIAQQIADALDGAHEKGIIHRDLKPANVAITPDGVVKVLDFGLAKVASEASRDLSTMAFGDTGAAVVIGTPAYMAPEQAQGRPVDKRVDVWAFGMLLYEMLAGKRPFAGNSVHETLAAVLTTEPDWEPIPPSIRPLLRRCLDRDPRRRLRDIGDFRFLIESAPATEQTAARPSRLRPRRLAMIAVLVLAFLISAVLVVRQGSWLGTGDQWSLQNAEIVQLTTTGNATLPAISPDGRYVAYVQRDGEDESVWIRQTTTASNVQIVPPTPGMRIGGITISPDGNWVDYLTMETIPRVAFRLRRGAFLGGNVRLLIEDVHTPVAWSPDGRQMAFVRGDLFSNRTELVLADADGRNERTLAVRESPAPRFYTVNLPGADGLRPTWSPDGQRITIAGVGFPDGMLTGYVLNVTVADGSVEAVPQTPVGHGAWIGDSSLLWSRRLAQGAPWQLWQMSYPGAQATRLSSDLSSYGGITVTADRDSFVTARREDRVAIWVGDGAATTGGQLLATAARPMVANGSSVAWAGDRLIYAASVGGALALVMHDERSPAGTEIVRDAYAPAVTSDGRLVYSSVAESTFNTLWRSDMDGRRAVQIAGDADWPVVTPDDTHVVFASSNKGRLRPWIVPLEGGTATQIADIDARTPDVSPDGRLLAFVSIDGQNQVAAIVCELPACDSPRRLEAPGLMVSLGEGGRIRWTPDGRGIAYVRHQPLHNLWVLPLDGSAPRQLTTFDDGREILDFAWSRDSQRLAIVRATATTDIILYKGLRARP